ncbi:MAG: class I SAM-dependent methyltransferase [Eubacteriales bacterium]|nr:class I SAM-dependent methyltransferase [Eubacteriales bacterium]
MDLEYIRNKWTNGMQADMAASISTWDSVAENFVYDDRVNLDEDSFLLLLQDKVNLTEDMTVLDVGCGAGAYSIALAHKVGKVVGVDYSPKMIEAAKRTAAQMGIDNVEFLVRDWYDLSDLSFEGQFDLVFAHNTPAIVDYGSFVKMIRSSRRYGLLCKPARRTDEVFDELRKMAGLNAQHFDTSVAYAFDTLWGHGLNPEIFYQDAVWQPSKSLEEAEKWYLGRLKGSIAISEKTENQIKEYLRAVSKDGQVEETIQSTLVNLFWEVPQ